MTDYERIEKVLKFLSKNYLQQPSLQELAALVDLSESHFQRLFTRWAGTSPKTFLQYLTAQHAKSILCKSRDLLNASLDSGLSGPSRLHDLMIDIEAMTPGEFKSGGQGLEIRYGFHTTPFGDCLIAVTKRGICHLVFIDTDQESPLQEMKAYWPNANFKPDKALTGKSVREIFYFNGKRRVSVLLKGTPFQVKVWEALLSVPEGHLFSYADIAKQVGAPKASRAVGTAIGRNSIAYLIPCHRVIRETGHFGGYRWGVERKQAVLAWESSKIHLLGSEK